MSCPNCGAQLEVSNQRFCQDCGAKLPEFSKSPELSQKPLYSPDKSIVPQAQRITTKSSSPRPLSKRSLAFGIVSLVVAVTSFNFGSSLILEPIILSIISGRSLLIALGFVNLVGTIFGSISISFNRKAGNIESPNKAMKVGKTLGNIGLALNIILTLVAFTFAPTFAP